MGWIWVAVVCLHGQDPCQMRTGAYLLKGASVLPSVEACQRDVVAHFDKVRTMRGMSDVVLGSYLCGNQHEVTIVDDMEDLRGWNYARFNAVAR